jgi:predicted small secreted protein
MRVITQRLLLLAALVTMPLRFAVAQSDQGAGQDMKDAAHSTKQAAKKTGHKVKNTTKKGTHKAAHKTKKGAQKVEDKTTPPPPQP